MLGTRQFVWRWLRVHCADWQKELSSTEYVTLFPRGGMGTFIIVREVEGLRPMSPVVLSPLDCLVPLGMAGVGGCGSADYGFSRVTTVYTLVFYPYESRYYSGRMDDCMDVVEAGRQGRN